MSWIGNLNSLQFKTFSQGNEIRAMGRAATNQDIGHCPWMGWRGCQRSSRQTRVGWWHQEKAHCPSWKIQGSIIRKNWRSERIIIKAWDDSNLTTASKLSPDHSTAYKVTSYAPARQFVLYATECYPELILKKGRGSRRVYCLTASIEISMLTVSSAGLAVLMLKSMFGVFKVYGDAELKISRNMIWY